jgi:hypothetical protein
VSEQPAEERIILLPNERSVHDLGHGWRDSRSDRSAVD